VIQTNRRLYVWAVLAAVSLCGFAHTAQASEASAFLGAARISDKSLGSLEVGDLPVALSDGFKTGGRLTLGGGLLAQEISYGYERHNLEVNGQKDSVTTVHQFFYDLVVHILPGGSMVRPFVVGGAGLVRFVPGDSELLRLASGETKFGWNYGGGVKIKLAPMFGVRFDVRDHVTSKPNFLNLPSVSGKLHDLEISGGVSLYF